MAGLIVNIKYCGEENRPTEATIICSYDYSADGTDVALLKTVKDPKWNNSKLIALGTECKALKAAEDSRRSKISGAKTKIINAFNA